MSAKRLGDDDCSWVRGVREVPFLSSCSLPPYEGGGKWTHEVGGLESCRELYGGPDEKILRRGELRGLPGIKASLVD